MKKQDKPLKAGRIDYRRPHVFPLPPKGETAYYLVTVAQNNTPVHPAFWRNLLAYRDYLDAELMAARCTYDKNRFRTARSVKSGQRASDGDAAWYDPKVRPYICDEGDRGRHQLAPGLLFCAEMNILPTKVRPLSGLETYSGAASGIFPHTKMALESVPTGNGERTKFNYTTGACTQRNYVQKTAGQKAEFHHCYGALVIEVASDGRWWVRQLNADESGTFYDLTVRVKNGVVTEGHRVQTISWGDVHATEIDPDVEDMNWGEDGILDCLQPRHQFLHDLFSFANGAGHHERGKFSTRLKKHVRGESVERDIQVTARFLDRAKRPFCETVVVKSNHDVHPERWLDEADFREDLTNAEVFLEAQLARVRAIKTEEPWAFLPWAMDRAGVTGVRFLGVNDSLVIRGVEYAWHGHLGPNGARGSTANLLKTCRKGTKGHDHQATIRDGLYSGGVCQLDMDYAQGPSSWSVSHVVQYDNGKRAIVTIHGDEPWANFA